MNYKINEIFYSLQGEGRWVGTPVIFIRFSGCNKRCWFCDTNFDNYEEISINELLLRIKDFPCNRVVLTGGEPMLQVNKELINALHFYRYIVHIESNGSIEIPDNLEIDWITISPKDANWIQKTGNELKLVYYNDMNIDDYKENTKFDYYYLQPCFISGDEKATNINIKNTINKCKENSKWMLSIQTHKLLKIQ